VASAPGAAEIENVGVVPDIEVEYPPHAYYDKHDPQLDQAIAEAQRMLSA
jgi:tricorn protease